MTHSFIALVQETYPDVWMRFIEHMNMTTLAVFLSILIGVPLGVVITKNRRLARLVIGTANIMQSLPSIALLALAIPLVGIGEKPAILMVIIYALLPIIKNTYTGLMRIDAHALEAADGIGLSTWQKLRYFEIPLAMPFVMTGVRISTVTAVGTMTVAAFAGTGGLGWFINMGLISLNADMVLLGAIPASLLALLLDYAFSHAEALLVSEGLKKPGEVRNRRPRQKLKKAVVASICALLFLLPMAHQGYDWYRTATEKKIVIGTSNFTEVLILGYLYEDLVTHYTDIRVERRFNLSGAAFCFSALTHGDIDTFVGYTGTVLMNVLHEPLNSDPDAVYRQVQHTLLTRYDVVTSRPLGFNNTYVFSVRPEFAQANGLTAMSDLLAMADTTTLGCTSEFLHREDGLSGIESRFGVHFGAVRPMDSTLRYQALANGDVDVIDAFSTDGLLKKMNLHPLPDDVHFFPPFYAVALTRADLFDRYPELQPLFAKLDGQISEEDMRAMNYAVDVDGQDPHQTAREFLIRKGLLPQ